MQFKRSLMGAAVVGTAMFSGGACAGASANVGAVSEYMFRGIAQTGGAAVQGGLDYATDFGLYVGTWASNIGFAGGTEQDFYVGFTKSFGAFGFDAGAIYYWYPEEDEVAADASTVEAYLGAILGPVTVKYSYADEANFFIGDGMAQDAGYLVAALSQPLREGLNLTANLGYYHGDEIERFLAGISSSDDTYIDYSIGLAKTIEGGFTGTFQYIATDIETPSFDDDPKFVVGLKKTFDL